MKNIYRYRSCLSIGVLHTVAKRILMLQLNLVCEDCMVSIFSELQIILHMAQLMPLLPINKCFIGIWNYYYNRFTAPLDFVWEYPGEPVPET